MRSRITRTNLTTAHRCRAAAGCLLLACLVASCGKSKPAGANPTADGGPSRDATSQETFDGKLDGAAPTTGACLDQPNTLPRPPEGRLPCELIPPGLSL